MTNLPKAEGTGKGFNPCPVLSVPCGSLAEPLWQMVGIRRGSTEKFHLLDFLVPVFTSRDPSLHEKYRVGLNRIAAREVPIEIKLVNPPSLNQLQTLEPKQMFWVRARGYIGKRTPELRNTLQESRPGYILPSVAWAHRPLFGLFPSLSPEPLPFNLRMR